MTELFLSLVNRSISAAWLILVVLVLRWLLKKAPKGATLALWALVAVRLVLPMSIPSAWSLVPSAETLPAQIIMEQTPAIDSGIAAVDALVNPSFTERFAPDPAASANPLQILSAILANVWLLGVLVMALCALIGWLRTRRLVREAVQVEGNVWRCDRVTSPFLFGLLQPKIYLPADMDAASTVHVLAHERAHLRHGDHVWKLLGFGILAVYWFQPLVWVGYCLFCRDLELACDERVVRSMDMDAKKAYSVALLACSMRRRAVIACPLAFGETGVKSRIQAVLHYKKPAFWLVILAIAACIAAAVCFLTDPKADADPPTLRDGTYQMEKGDWLIAPRLAISSTETDAQFHLLLDPVSSYANVGTYTVEGQTLVCKTADGMKTFRFRIAEDGTLRLVTGKSVPILARTQENEVRALKNGAAFHLVSAEAEGEAAQDAQSGTPTPETLLAQIVTEDTASACIQTHPEEYTAFVACGDDALHYVFTCFLAGGETGTHGLVLRCAMDELIGGEAMGLEVETGQEYFDEWMKLCVRIYNANGAEFMQKNNPKGWLLMQVLLPSGYDPAHSYTITFDGSIYLGVSPEEYDIQPGEQLATVKQSNSEPLLGCGIYACSGVEMEEAVLVLTDGAYLPFRRLPF